MPTGMKQHDQHELGLYSFSKNFWAFGWLSDRLTGPYITAQ